MVTHLKLFNSQIKKCNNTIKMIIIISSFSSNNRQLMKYLIKSISSNPILTKPSLINHINRINCLQIHIFTNSLMPMIIKEFHNKFRNNQVLSRGLNINNNLNLINNLFINSHLIHNSNKDLITLLIEYYKNSK